MDTTDKYRDMCRASKEIQGISPENSPKEFFTSYASDRGLRYIWLPRQDQLQEMVVDEKHGCDKWGWLISDFIDYYLRPETRVSTIYANYSMEQMWLTYVMEKNYDKKWVDGEWVANKP